MYTAAPRIGIYRERLKGFQGKIPSTTTTGWLGVCEGRFHALHVFSSSKLEFFELGIFCLKPLNWKGFGGPLPSL